MSPNNKVAIVTACGSGMGMATVKPRGAGPAVPRWP